MSRFPATIEELTPELLTSALAENRPGVVVERVRVAEVSRFGEGTASTADRVILNLDYAPGHDAGLPSRLLLKTSLLQRRSPRALYRNEVRFYRDIRPELAIEAPQAFASMIEEETGQFGIIMEDLKLRSARFPNATTPVTLKEVIGLINTLAELHAHFWTSPRFTQDLNWLPTPCSGGMYRVFKKAGLDIVLKQLEIDFKNEILRPLHRSAEQLWEDLWKVQDILNTEPTTLLHGDPHIGNTYLLPEGNGGLLDWQLMVKGKWAHDLTYLIVTALNTEDRRKHERDLIQYYLDELRRRGVEPPGKNEAWKLYRQAIVWGIVIGWLITPPQNYGQAITAANLSRLVTAALDLETFQALP
ncbi:MAG: phosphotransferase [Dehalococcoidia bacterium]